MLAGPGNIVVHVVKSVRWNLLFVFVCEDGFRSCYTILLLHALWHWEDSLEDCFFGFT